MKSIFVSYKNRDEDVKARLEQWETDSLLGELKISGGTGEGYQGSTEDYQGSFEEVEALLQPRLQGVSAMLVLVGDDSHSCRWMNREVKVAQKYNKKIVPVRVPGTTGAPPIAIRELPVIEFSPEKIAQQLQPR